MQFDQLKRREFITLLGGAAASTVVDTALSQPGAKANRVGLLTTSDAAGRRAALVPALEALGYREGQNLVLEVRSADGRLDQLPPLAEELIRAGVEVIVAVNSPGTQAAIASGTKIPIVMALVGDPVGTGFVPNLNRPGGDGHRCVERLRPERGQAPGAAEERNPGGTAHRRIYARRRSGQCSPGS
jgi:putative tryptophan/tyrosine transport system substrate-binding protein